MDDIEPDLEELNPNRNPEGNWLVRDRSNESLRLAYLLLWNFAQRLASGNPEELDDSFFHDLLVFKIDLSDRDSQVMQNYEKLMISVRQELNMFINGVSYPDTAGGSPLSLGIQDSLYLDQLATTLGGLDGIIGFCLAGNYNCSTELLQDLQTGKYSINGDSDSTKKRVKNLLEFRAKHDLPAQ